MDALADRAALGPGAAALALEDNPLHRFAVAAYAERFGRAPSVRWEPLAGPLLRWVRALAQAVSILVLALRGGLLLGGGRRRFVVLREAMFGLEGRGFSFHDDFVVDGTLIRKEDLLLMSRDAAAVDSDRRQARVEALRSGYAHCDLPALRLGLGPLFSRVLPLYVGRAVPALLAEAGSPNFSLYSSMFSSFVSNALPYERLFSNYEIVSELGHNYFSSSHIAEAIVCRAHGAAYYLMNWSDTSLEVNRFVSAFLGCDRFLVWGTAHARSRDGGPARIAPIGFFFKDRILAIRGDERERARVLAAMGLPEGRKVVSFYDEGFGAGIKMTEAHHIAFWEATLALAQAEPGVSVLVKPKGAYLHEKLSAAGRPRLAAVRAALEALPNVCVLDPLKWSFIEAIGVSDLAVTQGMTTSSLIALLSGIDALYLDQAHYDHPFWSLYPGRVVFDDPARLVAAARALLAGAGERPIALIPPEVLRRYDAVSDESGIVRLREAVVRGLEWTPHPVPGLGKVGAFVEGNPGPGVLEALKTARRVAEVFTLAPSADALAEACAQAKARGLDVVVRVGPGAPDAALVDAMVEEFAARRGELDCLTSEPVPTAPPGRETDVLSVEALAWADRRADTPRLRARPLAFVHDYFSTAVYRRTRTVRNASA